MSTPNSLLLFWRQYLRRPMGIGSIAPSSGALARAMVKALNPRPDEWVVELGPGTGIFTRELLNRGVRPQRLVLVEFDRQFAVHLRRAHRGVRIVRADARHLSDILRRKGQERVPKILSGLPLRGMTPALRRDISAVMAAALEPGGSLVQFTYFKTPPLDDDAARAGGLEVISMGTVMANLPPAFVWHYRKRLDA